MIKTIYSARPKFYFPTLQRQHSTASDSSLPPGTSLFPTLVWEQVPFPASHQVTRRKHGVSIDSVRRVGSRPSVSD